MNSCYLNICVYLNRCECIIKYGKVREEWGREREEGVREREREREGRERKWERT